MSDSTRNSYGLLPTGFASRTPNPAGQDGLRAVDPVVVRGGAAHNGTEVAPTGIWALAVTTDGDAFSARVSVPPQLGSQHLMRPFLPAPANASWSATTRTFNLGQPVWSSIFSNGGDLGRVSLTGSETRHVLYFPMGNGQNELTWPSVPPGGAGVDPAEESAAQFELVAVDLINSVTLNSLFDAPGLTLSTWARAVDGYSRLDR